MLGIVHTWRWKFTVFYFVLSIRACIKNKKLQTLWIILASAYIYILYQQFITWSMRADCGSYIVTLYIQTETTWTEKGREERIKES